ncbi:hypothetical protein [Bacillus weihaiensis]|uniref:hypothetical protein n=1 Tax=Bacillus weihaiensis TaxID=1547283 RepID=UPI002353CE11|nr:hypothetical protein [Bacillus weihaiensis]
MVLLSAIITGLSAIIVLLSAIRKDSTISLNFRTPAPSLARPLLPSHTTHHSPITNKPVPPNET